MAKAIFLIGFMGVGKTFLGQKLAETLEMDFFDLDFKIEKKVGMDVNEIFSTKGEKFFRQEESQLLLNWDKPGIISTGGGIVLAEKNREYLKSAEQVIWLNPSWEIINSRLENSYRPLVLERTIDELHELWTQRYHLYQECTDLIFTGNDLQDLLKLL